MKAGMSNKTRARTCGSLRAMQALLALLLGASLLGCAPQRIRSAAQEQLRAGDYEAAVRDLEQGLKQHPESTLLRAGLVETRTQAVALLLNQAATQRLAGRLDEAEAALQRVLAVEPGNSRALGLQAELQTEARQRALLPKAKALASQGRADEALALIAEGLRGNPRQEDLLALQRRLELEQRQAQAAAAQAGLAERRPVSLDFREASLRTVLDVVSRHSGINFILDKEVPNDSRVTVLLRAAPVDEVLDLITSTYQLAKKVIDARTVFIYPNTAEKQREHQEQVVKVFYLANGDPKGAAGFLKSMLKLREPFVDERSNMLAIREAPETVQLAERLMALYDNAEPEVLLEVEVLEVRSSRLTELGVKFPDTFALTALPPGGAKGLTLGNVGELNRDLIGLAVGGVTVNLRRDTGDFNTLANPRIRVKNREKAKVLIGDKVPVITTTTGTGGFVSDSISYLDVGLKLEVEPTVYADDEVAIKVALEVSSLAREIKTNSGSLAYQIGTRNASTLLRLRDGETQLLAGLISSEDRNDAGRVPGLGDLPVLGRLFSSHRDSTQRTELVLSVTPRVLRNLRRPDINQTELWVGTELSPRARPVGGLRVSRPAEAAATAGASGAAAAPAAERQTAGAAPTLPEGGDAPMQLRWEGPQQVRQGEAFLMTLHVSGTSPLRGLPLRLQYDRERLALEEIGEGEFFKQEGAETTLSQAIDPAGGQARVTVMRRHAQGASGQGRVLLMRLRGLAPGPAELRVVGADPLGAQAPVAAPKALPAHAVTIH